MGAIISLFARAIHCIIHKKTFYINFSLFVWTITYILLFFGLTFVLSYLPMNYWINIMLVSLGITVSVHLVKKISFEKLAVISILIFIIISVFNFYSISDIITKNQSNTVSNTKNELNISSTNNDEKSVVTEECREKAIQLIGDYFVINHYASGFLKDTFEDFSNFNFSTYGAKFRVNEMSGPLDEPNYYHTISKEIRSGNKVGEHTDWWYGNLEREYFYSQSMVTNSEHVILGENKFSFRIKIDDFSAYFSEKEPVTPYIGEFKFLAIPIESIITITECNFVD